jgi:hypothetical protein
LVRIEESAFYGSQLQDIVIPYSNEILRPFCFSGCESLTAVTFESKSGLVQIEETTFRGSGLQAIVIPSSVQTIGNDSFLNCSRLEWLTFDEGWQLRRIGRDAFKSVVVVPMLLSKWCRIV